MATVLTARKAGGAVHGIYQQQRLQDRPQRTPSTAPHDLSSHHMRTMPT
jgi:hypothetical protein